MCVPPDALDTLTGTTRIDVEAIEAPIPSGAVVGRAFVTLGDQPIGEAPITVDELGRAGWVRQSWDAIRVLFRSIGGNERPIAGMSLPITTGRSAP